MRPNTIALVTANMDKERGGDRAYLKHLRQRAGTPRVLFLQEVGHGVGSVKIRPKGLHKARALLLPSRTWRVGRVGVHNGVAVRTLRAAGQKVHLLSVHGLHVKTSGKAAQDAYYIHLEERVGQFGGEWIIGADFNRPGAWVAKQLGGTFHGTGVVGFVVSDGIEVEGVHTDPTAIRRRWSDHPAVTITVRFKEH